MKCVYSCGNVYNSGAGLQADGELGTVLANTSGRAQFRYMSQKLKVADIIGRSLSIDSDDGYVHILIHVIYITR